MDDQVRSEHPVQRERPCRAGHPGSLHGASDLSGLSRELRQEELRPAPFAPAARLDCKGLAWMLEHGAKVVAITVDAATRAGQPQPRAEGRCFAVSRFCWAS